MNFHLFGATLLNSLNINFYICLAIVVGFISVIVFFCFKGEKSFENFTNYSHLSGSKKKGKKKTHTLKLPKNDNFNEDTLDVQKHDMKHIEIKNSPEIFNENVKMHVPNNPLSAHGKSILRNSEEEILINKDECLENIWSKIPRDEVEILRSRHSSVASLSRIECKEEIKIESKLSRGQRKRLKAKHKIIDVKQAEKPNIQMNNSVLSNVPNEINKNQVSSTLNEENVIDSNKDENNTKQSFHKSTSLTSTDSSQASDKMRSFSSTENAEKLSTNDFVEDFQNETFDENNDDFSYQQFVNHLHDSEEKINLEREIKELKEEQHRLLLQLNDIPAMAAKMNTLEKEKEVYLKKYNDLERTCDAMKKELTLSIQKSTSTEGQMVRYKTEINQRYQLYENEISKLTAKVNFMENDNHSKAVEHEKLKSNIEQFHKHLQNQKIELSSINEQLYGKQKDCQNLEMQIKNSSMKLNELEDQKHLAQEETQKSNAQLEKQRRDMNKIQKEFENFKKQSKAQERQQDSIINNLQYCLDEISRERQQAMIFNSDTDFKDKKFEVPDHDSITNSQLEKEQQQMKYDKLQSVVNEYETKTANLEEQNLQLKDSYARLNDQYENRLKETVSLQKIVAEHSSSNNSDSTIDELMQLVKNKDQELCNVKESVEKLKLSIDQQGMEWRDRYNVARQENLKLENEVKCQASLVNNQNKKINEMTTLLQSYCQLENESMFNGSS